MRNRLNMSGLASFGSSAVGLAVLLGTSFGAKVAKADPAVPASSHPRLFMSANELSAYKSNVAVSGTAAAGLVKSCDDTLTDPTQYATRGGSDGNYWPNSASACAFAYVTTGQSKYLTQALKYWQASLSDDQTIGDGLGCKPGVSTNWQSWAQAGVVRPRPSFSRSRTTPVIRFVGTRRTSH